MTLVTHFACCHQYKGYWRSCPLGWSYFTVMPGLNLRASGAHAPEFTFSVVYHFGSLLGVSHDTACYYHYKGSDLSRLFRRVSGLICP